MESWPAGPNVAVFEPPDLFHSHIRGPVEEDQAKECVRLTMEELGKKRGIRVYFIAHMEVDVPGGPFTPAARAFLERAKLDWKAIVVIGGNPFTRFAASIVALAHSLLSDNKMPLKMVKSEDEAREYVARLRAKEEAAHRAA